MILTELKTYIENHPFAFQKRAEAAFEILSHIDDMFDSYLKRKNEAVADVLLDVYGLMQTLFVGVDALYDLGIGMTQYKYHININQNPVLRKLKYIRNDIVGHPTHRTYDDGAYGFSVIDESKMTRQHLHYVTYIVDKRETKTIEQNVNLPLLVTQYQTEKNRILEELHAYMNHKTERYNSVNLAYALVNKTLIEQSTLEDVDILRSTFIKEQNISDNPMHRVIWRFELLKTLFDWKDLIYQPLIDYLKKQQAYKVYTMICDIYDIKAERVHIPVPKVLAQFYKFLKKVPDALKYLDHIIDSDHPLYEKEIEILRTLNKQKSLDALLNWLLSLTDENKKYLVGQSFKLYRKK